MVRVLTFKILHGATLQGDFNLDVIAAVIKEADPDFVALQEVDHMTERDRMCFYALHQPLCTPNSSGSGRKTNHHHA